MGRGPILSPDPCYSDISAWAHYDVDNVGADTWVVLVDTSDTTTFPHRHPGALVLAELYLSVDRDNTGEGAVVLGVITAIDGTSAQVAEITHLEFRKETTTSHLETQRRWDSHPVRLDQSGGKLTHGITSDTYTVAALNTGTAVASPAGAASVVPAVADLVVGFLWVAGSYNSEAHVTYWGEGS